MEKEKLIKKMIAQVMNDFDFMKVRNVMAHIGWKWVNGRGKEEVPTLYQLIKVGEDLLQTCAAYYGEKDYYMAETGGFRATLNEDKLNLEFILEESMSFGEEFNNTTDEP